MAGTPQDRKKKRSGNPSQRAVTSAKAWKKASGADTVEYELPSGNVARIRLVTPETFMAQGLIPDSLTPIVSEMVEKNKTGRVKKKKGESPLDVGSVLTNPKQFRTMLEMMDRVLVYAVVEPDVLMPPSCHVRLADGSICGQYNLPDVEIHKDETVTGFHEYEADEKDPDLLYADEVDFEDKSAVMEFAMGGGTGDLEPFREAARARVGTVPDQQ